MTSTSMGAGPVRDQLPPQQAGWDRWRRPVFVAGVVAQCAIVVTGGLVRLTASGLGCPTWPQCFQHSYVPVTGQPQSFHKLIEFSNRLLTFVLTVILVAVVVAAWRRRPRRRSLVALAAASLAGVAAQAVIGGLSVLTDLNPYIVALHFLVSMPLIAAALAVSRRELDSGDGPPVPLVRAEIRALGFTLVALAGVVLVIGTLVTGSGPHSGDANHPARTGFDPARIAWLHADVVVLFVGMVIALLLALHLTDAPRPVRRSASVLLAVTLGQGLIGYVQFFTGVPWGLVSVHIAGAVVLWVAVQRVVYSMRTRD